MAHVQDATKEFFHKEGVVSFTVCAWNQENAASDGEPAYRGGGTINVNPSRLLMEPESVEARLLELEPTLSEEVVAKAVETAGTKLRAFWGLKTDALGDVVSLHGLQTRIPADSIGAEDYAMVQGLRQAEVRDLLRDHARRDLANELAARETP